MDTDTIKKLIKIAEANLKVARADFQRIVDDPAYEESEHDWRDAIEEANSETYACEQVIDFLKSNLETSKTK